MWLLHDRLLGPILATGRFLLHHRADPLNALTYHLIRRRDGDAHVTGAHIAEGAARCDGDFVLGDQFKGEVA